MCSFSQCNSCKFLKNLENFKIFIRLEKLFLNVQTRCICCLQHFKTIFKILAPFNEYTRILNITFIKLVNLCYL